LLYTPAKKKEAKIASAVSVDEAEVIGNTRFV